jgi:hypothetical protein
MHQIDGYSYTQCNEFLIKADLSVSTNTATAKPLHESEPTKIRWLIIHTHRHIWLGRTFRHRYYISAPSQAEHRRAIYKPLYQNKMLELSNIDSIYQFT